MYIKYILYSCDVNCHLFLALFLCPFLVLNMKVLFCVAKFYAILMEEKFNP